MVLERRRRNCPVNSPDGVWSILAGAAGGPYYWALPNSWPTPAEAQQYAASLNVTASLTVLLRTSHAVRPEPPHHG